MSTQPPLDERIKKELPETLERKIKLNQNFPRIQGDCKPFRVSVEVQYEGDVVVTFTPFRQMDPYSVSSREYFNRNFPKELDVAFGNICRAIDKRLKNEVGEFWKKRDIIISNKSTPYAGQSGPVKFNERNLMHVSSQNHGGLPNRGCSWRIRSRLQDNGKKKLYQTIQDAILIDYNKGTTNEVKLIANKEELVLTNLYGGATKYGNPVTKKVMEFEICKPKNSLRELVKNRINNNMTKIKF